MMRALVPDNVRRLQPYPPGKPIEETERELGIRDIIKLASNENPLGTSPRALAAMRQAVERVALYPDGNAYYLKAKLAERLAPWGVKPEMLIVGNGTNDVIDMAIRTFVAPGEHAVSGWPAFVMYRLGLIAADRAEVAVPLDAGLGYDVRALAAAVGPQTKLLFIANPNNPTGRHLPRAELEWLFDHVPQDVVIFLDEAYCEYATAADYPNGLDYLARRPRLIVARTFSKIYGLAGVRLGYGVAHPELIDFMNRGREPFNTSLVAQAAGVAALDDLDFERRSREQNAIELAWLQEQYARLGLRTLPSAGNFVCVHLGRSGVPVFQAMLRQGVIIRPTGNYDLPDWVRITVGTRPHNERMIAALTAVLAG